MFIENQILMLARRYAQRRNITLSSVSTYACGDGSIFEKLSQGKSITAVRARKVINWFSENWPADLAWPDGVERPNHNIKQKEQV